MLFERLEHKAMNCKGVRFACWAVLLCFGLAWAGLPATAYSQMDGYALLLQQSPPDGGTITPEAGVHHFAADSTVTITAVPSEGYQFVYWSGDVDDPTSPSTTVELDSPKIVIAVFERAKFDFLLAADEIGSRSIPIGGAVMSGGDYAQQGFWGGGGRRPRTYRQPPEEEEEVSDFPVPEEGDEFPVPVPEPTTVAFLLGGIVLVLRGKRSKFSRFGSRRLTKGIVET